jgi:acetyl-CoA C-acetyltransferase
VADRLGIPAERRVHPWSAAACHEPYPLSERPHPDRPVAGAAAAERALALADLSPGQLDLVDLYSCFPAAVQFGASALGLPLDGSRALSVTGGLPYFGGPGASYTAHAIVTMVEECRAQPGAMGAVLGLGGMISNFAVGTYSTGPPTRPWSFDDGAAVAAQLRTQRVPIDLAATGVAVVEAQTVVHRRDEGPTNAPVFVRFADGRRSAARPADPALPAALVDRNLVGAEVRLEVVDGRNVFHLV